MLGPVVAQVETINAAEGATEPTVLGPFYLPGAPHRAQGEHIGRPEDGEPTLIRGRVTGPAGEPLAGATLDMWQCSSNGLYDIQDPRASPTFNLRGIFTTGPDGRYWFRTVRPVSYPVPIDGPVGDMLPRVRPATTGAPRTCTRSSRRLATSR